MTNSENKEQGVVLEHYVNSGDSKHASRAVWVNCQVGDVFTFGNYPQGTRGEIKPIEWQVVRRDNDGLLVIARYALDSKRYNEASCDITWSQCTLRKWLNDEFINKAFDASERKQIQEMHLNNPNSKFNKYLPGGPDTDDKIFLLSHDEAESLFADDDHRLCKPTDYAIANNARTWDNNGTCCWWLRSPGSNPYLVATVCSGGDIYDLNRGTHDNFAVRPAFKIAL